MQLKSLHLVCVLFLLNVLKWSSVASLNADGLSLLSLKYAVDASAGDVFSDWNENDATPCLWAGIFCSAIPGVDGPRVVGVSVAGRNLRGYIPSELGGLMYLRRLNLHGNNLYGSIPAQLFNASSLHTVYLYGNNLSGSLPPSLCGLLRVQNVDVSNNSLSGLFPKFLHNCRQLKRLILSGNMFSGEISDGIFSELVNLEQLDLSANMFNGSIPDDIGQLKSLSGTLNLSFNHFTGEIPKSLGDLSPTVSFDLRNNDLNGEIPRTGAFANQGPIPFLNNPGLCGFPLQRSCKNGSESESDSTPATQENGDVNIRKRLKTSSIIMITVADAIGVMFIGLVILYIYWKNDDDSSCSKKTKLVGLEKTSFCASLPCLNVSPSNNESEIESEKDESGKSSHGEGNLVAIDKGFNFELDELLRASAYALGKSGLGIVYKVMLGNGVPVVVRRLGGVRDGGGEQSYKEFVAQVQIIGRIKHPNVVKLRAYYWTPDEKLLISDFISNGNLASALRGKPGFTLTWSMRLKIAKGIARGLAYIHECSNKKLIHGDIKPSNILLDDHFQPYISGFGLNHLASFANNPSSIVPYVTHPQTDTRNNYRAPESRISGSNPTKKWDVYSFGVILLEILAGKSYSKMVDLMELGRKDGFSYEMVDPMLIKEVHAKKEMVALFQIAMACTETDPELRPRMKTVSKMSINYRNMFSLMYISGDKLKRYM